MTFDLAVLNNPVTSPAFHLELGFAPPVRYCSAGTVNWNGFSWVEKGFEVSELDVDVRGLERMTVTCENLDLQLGVVTLAQVAKDKPVKIWLTYDPWKPDSPRQLLMSGFMDGAVIGDYIVYQVISDSTYYGAAPRVNCAPPVFNHLPPSGTIVRWGSTEVTVETR